MGNLNKHETGKIETFLKNGKTTNNKKTYLSATCFLVCSD